MSSKDDDDNENSKTLMSSKDGDGNENGKTLLSSKDGDDNENYKTLMSSKDGDDNGTMNQNNNNIIKELNDSLDEIIDKSKSF